MKIDRVTRRFAAWIACFAIIVAALAPAMTHLLPGAQAAGAGAGQMEICTAGGARLSAYAAASVAAIADTGARRAPGLPSDAAMHGDHCQFCFTHADSVGLPPSVALALTPTVAVSPRPFLFYQSPSPLFVWAHAPSRAPPAIA